MDSYRSMFYRAVSKNYFPRVKQHILMYPEDIERLTDNEEGMTPLLESAMHGCTETFLVLLKAGANSKVTTNAGLTALQLAAREAQIKLLAVAMECTHFSKRAVVREVMDYITSDNPTKQTNSMISLEAILFQLHKDYVSSKEQHKGGKEEGKDEQVTNPTVIIDGLQIELVLEKVLEQAMTAKDVSLVTHTAKAISRLIRLTSISESILRTRIPHLLTTIMETMDNKKACYRALAVVMDILQTASSGSAAMNHIGGPRALLHTLKKYQSKELHSVVMNYIKNCSCIHPEVAVQFDFPEILRYFLDSMSATSNPETVACTMGMLDSMVNINKAIREKLIGNGLVEKIMLHLKPFDKVLTPPAVTLLKSLCVGMGDVEETLKQHPHTIAVLLQITEQGMSMEARQKTFEILWQTTGDSDAEKRALGVILGPECLITQMNLGRKHLQYLAVSILKMLTPPIHNKQKEILFAGGVLSLVKQVQTGETATKLLALEALENLSCKVGMRPNKETELLLWRVDGMQMLLHLLQEDESIEIRQQALCTISAFSMQSKRLKRVLLVNLKLAQLLLPFQSEGMDMSMTLMKAMSYLAYGSVEMQSKMLGNGGMHLKPFVPYLSSHDPFQSTQTSFNVIIFARVLVDVKRTHITARAIAHLTKIFKGSSSCHGNEVELQVHTLGLISSLLHLRAGLADSFISLNIIPPVIAMLLGKHDGARQISAITLCFLSFFPTASRLILRQYRDMPKLYTRMEQYSCGHNPSKRFVDEWDYFKKSYNISERR